MTAEAMMVRGLCTVVLLLSVQQSPATGSRTRRRF